MRDWKRFFLHPLWALPLFIIATQAAQERLFPLSCFPMYANPEQYEDYVYLTDGNDKPVSIQTITGLSASKLNKTYRTKIKQLCSEKKVSKDNPPDEVIQAAVSDLLAKVKERATARKKKMPETIKLVEVIISREGNTLNEKTQILGQTTTR